MIRGLSIIILIIIQNVLWSQNAAHVNIESRIPICDPDTLLVFDTTVYGNDIFGVGRDTAKIFYQPKSTSVSYKAVTIEVTTDIKSDHYLVCGHDNGSLVRAPIGSETNALQRTWYADMSGAVGTVNMELDLALITAVIGSPPADVKILIANNAAFTNYHTIEATSVVAGIAYFEGIPLYSKYFTFSAP